MSSALLRKRVSLAQGRRQHGCLGCPTLPQVHAEPSPALPGLHAFHVPFGAGIRALTAGSPESRTPG